MITKRELWTCIGWAWGGYAFVAFWMFTAQWTSGRTTPPFLYIFGAVATLGACLMIWREYRRSIK